MIDLTDKHVVINGGKPALADGIANAMRNAGATVHHQIASAQDKVSPDDTTASIAAFDRIDTMIILPDYYVTGDFMATTSEQWDSALAANYERAVYLAQAGANHMIERAVQGSIIFISTVAIHTPLMETSVFSTSLAPLYPLAKMAAVECGQYGIRVNTITLGWVEDGWGADHLADAAAREHVTAGIPLGEIADPAAVGDMCCFLASPLAHYITGSIIPVDGGYTLTRADGNSPYSTN